MKSFCGGELKNEGWKGRKVEGEKINKKIEGFDTRCANNFFESHNIRHFGVFLTIRISQRSLQEARRAL
jgi:hypothetical protein